MDKLAGDGPSDSHKAPELSGIRTVEFLRNWLAERLSRFRFVTEQKGGWQGGNVQPLELVSKEAQLEECSELASPCLRSLHFPTVLYGKSGQSLGCAVGAQTVVAGAKKWRKHSGVPGYTHQKQTLVQSSATHCLAALNKGADGPWVGSGDSPTFVLLQHCPHLPLHKQMRTKKSY